MYNDYFALQRDMRNYVELSISAPVSAMTFNLNLNLISNNFHIKRYYPTGLPAGDSLVTIADTNEVDSWTRFKQTTDIDLWSSFQATYELPLGFFWGIGTLSKTNLTDRGNFNLSRYEGKVGGAHEIFMNNHLNWNLAAQWYNSEQMADSSLHSAYATKAHWIAYIRDVFKFGDNWYLKGTYNCRYSNTNNFHMFKQRIELSVRKAWDNESSVEVGAFESFGGLFPTSAVYIRSYVQPSDIFYTSATLRTLWEGPDKKVFKVDTLSKGSGSKFIRAGGALEAGFFIFKNSQIFAGFDYTYYEPSYSGLEGLEDFPSRGALYVGIRNRLP
jgi:hypothetical protein